MKPRGRPPLEYGQLRVQVCTTLPQPIAEQIRNNNLKINELIIDGLKHRTDCKIIDQKIMRLQALYENTRDELELFKLEKSVR